MLQIGDGVVVIAASHASRSREEPNSLEPGGSSRLRRFIANVQAIHHIASQ